MYPTILLSTLLILFPILSHAAPLTMNKIDEGIYVHHGVHEDLSDEYHGDICNLSFIVGNKGIAVIDSGGSYKVGQALHEAIREVSQLPILYVINTHVHPDHIFGNAAFEKDNVNFVGHAKLADAMERRKETYMRINQQWLGEAFAGSKLIKPTIIVDHDLSLDLGDRKLTLTAFPTAHTNTDITILDHKTQTLWTGDLLIAERTPSLDGDIKGWISVLEELNHMNLKQVVYGHGGIGQEKKWKQNLSNHKRYLNVLLNDVRKSIGNSRQFRKK
jgi:quinoprotein relay system zinc metallohydrolase 2